MSDKIKIISTAVGRRKRAIASVRLISGKGEIVVNDKPISQYFPGILSQSKYTRPFSVLSLTKYDATVRVHGGGLNGQLDATILGIANALAALKKDFKDQLRDADLMTRDSRKRQRRMVGMGGKSRRKKQSPKR